MADDLAVVMALLWVDALVVFEVVWKAESLELL